MDSAVIRLDRVAAPDEPGLTATLDAPAAILYRNVSYRFGADGKAIYRTHYRFQIQGIGGHLELSVGILPGRT